MRIIWSSGFAAVVVSFTAAVLGYRPIIDVNAYYFSLVRMEYSEFLPNSFPVRVRMPFSLNSC